MKSTTIVLSTGLICAIFFFGPGPAAGRSQENKAEIALQAAIKTETVDGDLKGAIEQYKAIAALPGAGRATVATALLRMGQCHEKLGQTEARAAYERLIRDYSDQAGVAAQARARLAALGGGGSAGGLVTRRIVDDASEIGGTLTADGKYLRNIDWYRTGDGVHSKFLLMVTLVVTRRRRSGRPGTTA